MSIVNTAMRFLGPAVVSKIASMLGINNTLANRAIAAALPAIMAAIAGRASSPSGAQSLLNMAKGQDQGVLNNFESAISGTDGGLIQQNGLNNLSGLLGDNALGSLSNAMGGNLGMNEATSRSLLGLVGPVALGSLGEEVSRNNLDPAGLAQFLEGQKEHIAEAIPNDFAAQLEGTGLLDSIKGNLGGLGGLASGAAAAAGGVAMSARDAAADVGGAVGDVAGGIGDAARDAVSGVGGAVGDIAGGIGDAASDAVSGVGDIAGEIGGAARDAASGGISGAGALAGGAVAAAGAAAMSARDAVTDAGDAVGDAAGSVRDGAERAYAGASERVRDAGSAVRDTAGDAYDSARDAGHATARGVEQTTRSGFGWLKWLLPLILLAALAWYFLGNMTKPEMPGAALEQSMTVGDVNVAESFRGTVDDLKTSFGSITDVESAQAALPGLTEAAGKVEGLSGMAENLSGPAKGAFGGMVSTALAALRPMIETAVGLPGVGPIIEPVVTPMLEQLDAMAG